VARSIANNRHAQLSDNAFSTLVKRAEEDSVLAEKVGMRTDIPPRLFRQLLMRASDVVQKRLLAKAKPETQTEIRRVLAQVTDEVAAKAAPRNYAAALATVRALHSQAQAKGNRHRGIRQVGKVRGDHCRSRNPVRGPRRGCRPAHERRARRSGSHSRARKWVRLVDRKAILNARPGGETITACARRRAR
jgi:hypothetical protein